MPHATELSQAQIEEIVALRGVAPPAEIRHPFGIGTSRLYRIWKNAEAKGKGKGKGETAKQVVQVGANGKAAGADGKAAAGAPGQTALAPAGANGKAEATDVAMLLPILGRMEEQLGRLAEQQALLLESQEGHYEDVEELEGTVEKAVEEGTSMLDNLEEGSRQARTTFENVLAAANAAKEGVLVLLGLGVLGLLLWTLSEKAAADSLHTTKPARAPHTPAPAGAPHSPAPATAGVPVVPVGAHKPAHGIQRME